MLGLAGMAVEAEARSTLAYLWAVNDRSTTILMHEFVVPSDGMNSSEHL